MNDDHIQSEPIKRLIYVRPLKELGKRVILWSLKRIPYWISEAGSLWSLVMEKWLKEEAVTYTLYGVPQFLLNGMVAITY